MSSIKKNYAYSMAYQVLALLVPFVTIPYVSRVLGADGVGTYSFSLSVVTYFMLASALGVQGYGSREMSRLRDDTVRYSKVFWEISLLVTLTTLACSLVWIALAIVATEYTLYFLAFLPMLISVLFDISWFYIGLEKMGHVVLRNTVVKLAGVVLLFVFVREPTDLLLYIMINSFVQLAGNLTMWFTLPGLIERPRLHGMRLGLHFKETLVYFVPTLAASLYTVLDKTLIGVLTGDPFQNGYYEQADKVVRMAMTLTFTSVNLVVGARLSYLFEKGEVSEAKERAEKSLDFILLFAFAFAFGISAIAGVFVPVFFGEGYEPVVLLLRFMCPLIVIIGISNCLGSQYYTPSGRRAQSARYIVVGAICNIVLSVALIPILGMYGALLGSTVAELVITVLYLVNCGWFISWSDVWRCSWKRLIAGIAATVAALACVVLISASNLWLLFVEMTTFVLVYVGLLAIMRDHMLLSFPGMVRGALER